MEARSYLGALIALRTKALSVDQQRGHGQHESIQNDGRERVPALHHQGGEEGSHEGGGPCHHPLANGLYHLIRITHRDDVEHPITDWLQEAYMLSNELSKPGASKSTPTGKQTAALKPKNAQQSEKVQRKAGPASKRGL